MKKRFLSELLKLENNIKDKKFLIGYSGGPDSTFLSLMLKEISEDYNIKIELGYLCWMPGIEYDEVLKEKNFVENFAKSQNLKLISKTIPYCNKIQKSSFKLFRKYKYELLLNSDHDFVIMGHHMNDNVENFIFRILRGSSFNNLFIPSKRDKILRPLLNFEKNEILKYLNLNNINFYSDPENDNLYFSRHIIRHEIFPIFKKINFNFMKHINNLSNKENLETETIKNFLQQNNIKYNKNKIKNIHQLDEGILNVKKNIFLIKKGNELNLQKNKKEIQKKFFHEQEVDFENFSIKYKIVDKIENKDFKEQNVCYANADKIDFKNLYVRSKKSGDVFYPLGMKGKKKKIKDLFIDKKISRIIRNQIPILFSNKDIVWIAGYADSENYKINNLDNKICKFEIKFKNN